MLSSPIPKKSNLDQQVLFSIPEKSTEVFAEDKKVTELAQKYIDNANAVSNLPPEIASKITHKYERSLAKSRATSLKNTIFTVFNTAMSLAGLIKIAVDIALGAKANAKVTSGVDFAMTGGGQISSGADYFTKSYQIRQLKKEHAELKKIISEIENIPEKEELTQQLQSDLTSITKQLERLKVETSSKGKELLISTFTTTLEILSKALSFTNKVTQKIGATSLGLVAGEIGLGLAVFGIVTGSAAIKETDNLIENLNAVGQRDQAHITVDTTTTDKIIDETVNTAIRAAQFQKTELGMGVFRDAFTACSSVLGMTGGIIAITALSTSVAASAAAVSFTGIGLPVVGGVGAVIAGGVFAYAHRHTIARGLQAILGSYDNQSERGRFSLQRNLTIRNWTVKRSLKKTESKLNKLTMKYAQLEKDRTKEQNSLTIQNPGISKEIEISELYNKILKKAEKHIDLTKKSEETRYKRALQNLRDKTTYLPFKSSGATKPEKLVLAVDKLADENLGIFVTDFKKAFPGATFDKLDQKDDKKQYIKTQILKGIAKGSLFNT